ncbi:MAG TPA: class I SAM-dependent methyltransferase [Acidimicrobiia bacterium]|jgi:hypothetical protein
MSGAAESCWACGSKDLTSIYEVDGIPLSSLILMTTPEEAVTYPRGDLQLVVCQHCAFIFNAKFSPDSVDYTQPYEESQAHSPRFRVFEQELVDHLINDYDLTGRLVFEIGCGKASFLERICRQAGARGLGIDPSFDPERAATDLDIKVLKEYFDADHTDLTGDLICCRHTLEHIGPVAEFVGLTRISAGHSDAVVFFEIPDADRILAEGAFWDVYNEHCSYFTLASLSNLFRSVGFGVLRLQKGFDDQYLLIDAKVGAVDLSVDENAVTQVVEAATEFTAKAAASTEIWRRAIDRAHEQGKTVMLWGASSKAVGFLSAIERNESIAGAVDINPFKQNLYLPGSGHLIVGPSQLQQLSPDLVIVMNPIYVPEITEMLDGLGLHPETRAVGVSEAELAGIE